MKSYNTEIIKNAFKRVGWLTRTPGVRRYIQFGKLVELKECVLYSNGVAVEAKDEHEIRPAMWITLDVN